MAKAAWGMTQTLPLRGQEKQQTAALTRHAPGGKADTLAGHFRLP